MKRILLILLVIYSLKLIASPFSILLRKAGLKVIHVTTMKNAINILEEGHINKQRAIWYNQNPSSYRRNIYLSLRSERVINFYRTHFRENPCLECPDSIFIFRPEILDQMAFSHLTTAQVFGNFIDPSIVCPRGTILTSARKEELCKATRIIQYLSETEKANELVLKHSIPIFEGLLEKVILPKDLPEIYSHRSN